MQLGVKRRRGVGKLSSKQTKKQSYQALIEKYQLELQEQESQKHVLEGKLKVIQNVRKVAESLVKHQSLENLPQDLDITEAQAASIVDMKLSDFLPQNKAEIQQEISEIDTEMKRLQQLSEDYQACLRVFQYEEQQISEAEEAERQYIEMYNLEDDSREQKKSKKKKEKKTVVKEERMGSGASTSSQHLQDIDNSLPNKQEFVLPIHSPTKQRQQQNIASSSHTHSQNLSAVSQQQHGSMVVGYMEGRLKILEFNMFMQGIDTQGDKMGKLDQYIVTAEKEGVLLFTTSGHAYSIKAGAIPERGSSPKQLLGTCADVQIAGMIGEGNINEHEKLILLTKLGQVKCSRLRLFSRYKQGGQIALGLYQDDEVIQVARCHPSGAVMIGTSQGRVVGLCSKDIPDSGKGSKGIKAVRLRGGDCVVSLISIDPQVLSQIPSQRQHQDVNPPCGNEIEPDDNDDVEIVGINNAGPWLLIITAKGLFKRVPICRFRRHHSTSLGMTSSPLRADDEVHTIMFIPTNCSTLKILVCTEDTYSYILEVDSIPVKSRQANGKKMIQLDSNDKVRQVMLLPKPVKQEPVQNTDT